MGRRTNGEGCVYSTGDGKYVARIQIGWRDNGRPKIKSFAADSKKKALKRMNDYLKSCKSKDELSQWNGIMSDCMKQWLEKYKLYELKASSYDRIVCTVDNNIIPYIGDYHIEDITPAVIQKEVIYNLCNKGLSYSTVKKAYNALNNFYKCLQNEDVSIKNPMTSVKLPPESQFDVKEETKQTLSLEEIKRFEETASQFCKSINKPIYRHGFGYIFILYTGIRCGEALGLQYKHIDWGKRELTINQSMVYVINRERSDSEPKYQMKLQKTAKTAESVRKIPICNKAYEAIRRHKELYYRGNDEDYIFLTSTGKPMRTRNFERGVNYIFKAAGIDAAGLHILRHSFASMLFAQKGINIKYISKLLGHRDVQVTYKHYVFTMEEKEKEYRDILDTL